MHTQAHADVSLYDVRVYVYVRVYAHVYLNVVIRNSGCLCLTVERKRAKQMEEMRSQRSGSESAQDQMTEEEEEFVAEVQGNKINWLKEKVFRPH